MIDRSPRLVSRLRIFIPLAVLVLILAGASTAFASGAFESNDSGFDSARDVAERGTVAASTTTTTLPDANDDKGVDPVPVPAAATPAPSQDQSTVTVPDGSTSTFGAGDAGSVTILRTGGTLSIVSVSPNAGWMSEIEQGSGAEVEVKFVNGTTRIDFNAELEEGGVRVRVRASTAEPATPDPTRVDNSGPGNANDDTGSDDHGSSGGDESGHEPGHESGHGGHGSGDDSGDD